MHTIEVRGQSAALEVARERLPGTSQSVAHLALEQRSHLVGV